MTITSGLISPKIDYPPNIISKKNMKHLKKNCIYFIVIFTIAVACGFAGLVIKEVNKGTFYDLPTEEALNASSG